MMRPSFAIVDVLFLMSLLNTVVIAIAVNNKKLNKEFRQQLIL